MLSFAFYLSVMGGMGAILAAVQQISDRSFQRNSGIVLAFCLSVVVVALFQIVPVLYFRMMMNHIGNTGATVGLVSAFGGFTFFWLVLEKVISDEPVEAKRCRSGEAARAYAKVVANREY